MTSPIQRPDGAAATVASRELTLRIASGLVLALVAGSVAWFGGYLFIAFWLLAAIVVLVEWLRITRSGGPLWWAAGLLFACAVAAGPILLRLDPAFGIEAIVWLFAVVWVTDIMAYVSGRSIGGPKLWPRVSPKKTWAGFIGGTVFGIAAGTVVAMAADVPDLIVPGLLAALAAVATHAGDLLESSVKRHFGVKDAGHIIPGHGGVMDRLDGFAVAGVLAALIGSVHLGWGRAAEGLLVW
jgi:phosphatidate cytidylyltransferase